MVYKEILFYEYTFDGRNCQWAVLTIGKSKKPTEIMITYDKRICTDKSFTLYHKGETIIALQEYTDFDIVRVNMERQDTIIYSKEDGFNSRTLLSSAKVLRWM